MASLLALLVGCQTGPKRFTSVDDPSAVVRARAVGLSEGQPDAVVVPALISRLEDSDPVVRLTAYEALKRRTGQNFGYAPYREPHEQADAIEKWRSWWNSRPASATSSPAEMPVPARQARRGRFRR